MNDNSDSNKKKKKTGENIPGGNFPGGFTRGSLMDGNFPGGSFPDTRKNLMFRKSLN